MKMPERKNRRAANSILPILAALALFASPFTASWAGFTPPWYLPYLLWAGLIALTAFIFGSARDDDD